jgi:ribosome maturation factor RimP
MTVNYNAGLCSDVKKFLQPIVEKSGFEIFDVTFRRESSGRVLRVTIDGENVNIDDCANISRILSEWLDNKDLIPDVKYSLEVSTPGLNRPLRHIEDFKRFKGSICSITLKNKESDGRKRYKGVIVDVEGQMIKIFVETENQHFDIDVNKIKKANLEIV